MELTQGEHVITFEGVGKNDSATNYKMGVIHIVLYDEEALAVKNMKHLQTRRGIYGCIMGATPVMVIKIR